jgi:hypothetical protein
MALFLAKRQHLLLDKKCHNQIPYTRDSWHGINDTNPGSSKAK